MLNIDSVYKIFHGHNVLDNINLSFERNDIIGLAGPSGGGKSTLLRCIQRLERIDSGKITLDGCSIHDIKNIKTGFMFQDFQLFPHMTVIENITYAPKLHKDVNAESKAIAMLKDLGLEHKINNFPHQLSGGQKQRVAMARSLLLYPNWLLCDEPTSGLDVATISDVVSLLKSVRDKGVSMIIASHDLDFLTQIADRVVVLKEGSIVADVRINEINTPIEYLKSYYIQT